MRQKIQINSREEDKEDLEQITMSEAKKIFAWDITRVAGTAFFLIPLTDWGCRVVYNNFYVKSCALPEFLLGMWVGSTGVFAIASLIAAGGVMAKQYFKDKSAYFRVHHSAYIDECNINDCKN